MKIATRRKALPKTSQQQVDASVVDATVEVEEDTTVEVDQEDSTVAEEEAEIEEDENVEGEDADAIVEEVEGEDDNQEEELVDQGDEVEEELVDQEGEVDDEQEYEEVEGENEEDADDDHEVEIAEDEGEEDEEGEGDADEDEATAENDELKKFPTPLNSAGDFSSIENSELRSILEKSKIKLYDGSQGLLFSRGPKYSDEKWPINCHICYESGLMNLKQLKEHLKSTRHIRMMRWRPTDPKYKHAKAFRQPFEDDDPTLTPIFIYPGEVITEITPDLIDRIIGTENVSKENHSRMVGLSYAYKMNRFGKEMYDCILCRKNALLKHFASQQHIDKYIEVHYRKTWKRLRTMLSGRTLGWGTTNLLIQQKYIRAAIRIIYKKVEAEKGARQAKFVSSRDFKINRVTYQQQALNKKHYDDKTIEITDDLLKQILKQVYDKFGPPKKYEKLSADEIIGATKPTNRPRRLPSSEKWKRPRMAEGDAKAWDRYRRMIGANLDDLEEVYDRYLKDLESHPRYKKEWKKFWHNRADELEKKGIDPHKYDFNREWIPYWEKRLREFHARDIVKQKFETKRKLKLPNDVRSPSPVRRPKRIAGRKRSPSPRSRQVRRRSRSRSRSPKRMRQNEPTTVVGVMRLVAALEDNLGSLGPQAVQLLSRAVLTEKSNPNPDSLLMENDFYIFFMTVKEKLKGQLQANILEPRKVNAVDRVIYQITIIINKFEEHRARHGNRSSQYQNNQSGARDGAASGGGVRGAARPNRYPNQYSGGSRGGVWHSGNYRMETGGNMPPNQNYQDREDNDNSMNFQQMSGGMGFGGDGGGNNDDSFVSQTGGNGYSGNRSGRMNRSISPGPQSAGDSHRNQMSGGGGNSASFGRSDFDNGNGPPMYGGNNSGNFGNYGSSNPAGTDMGYNRGGGVRSGFSGDGNFNASYRTADSQREQHSNMGGGVGPNRGGRYSDGSNKSESHISHNRNSMPLNRGGNDRDFSNLSNRDGNQMSFNRGPNRGADLDTMPQSPTFGPPNPPTWPTSGGYQGGNEVSRQQYSGGGMDSMKTSYNAGGSNMSRGGGGGGNHGGPSTEMRGGNRGGGGGGMPSMGWNRTNQMNVQFNRGLNSSGRY